MPSRSPRPKPSTLVGPAPVRALREPLYGAYERLWGKAEADLARAESGKPRCETPPKKDPVALSAKGGHSPQECCAAPIGSSTTAVDVGGSTISKCGQNCHCLNGCGVPPIIKQASFA